MAILASNVTVIQQNNNQGNSQEYNVLQNISSNSSKFTSAMEADVERLINDNRKVRNLPIFTHSHLKDTFRRRGAYMAFNKLYKDVKSDPRYDTGTNMLSAFFLNYIFDEQESYHMEKNAGASKRSEKYSFLGVRNIDPSISINEPLMGMRDYRDILKKNILNKLLVNVPQNYTLTVQNVRDIGNYFIDKIGGFKYYHYMVGEK